MQTRKIFGAAALVAGAAGAAVLLYGGLDEQLPKAAASGSDNVTGWAWSSNIGWLSLNSTTSGSAVDFGVNIDSNGDFSGEAWSSNIGWISFNQGDTGPPPSNDPCGASCIANLDFGTGQIAGWARALSPAGGGGGGWDGWIRLRWEPGDSGPDWSADSLEWNPSTEALEGFAWGSDVVGWLKFDCATCNAAASVNVPPTAAFTCSDNDSAPADCVAWSSDILTLNNMSSDPNGPGDIAKSEWDLVAWGSSPNLECPPGVPTLCSYAVAAPPGTYAVELFVQDRAGNSDVASGTSITMKQDAEADFQCSLDASTWTIPCSDLLVQAGATVYFRGKDGTNLSIPSEEGTTITSWATGWSFDDGICNANCGTSGESPNFIEVTFPASGTKTVSLFVEDDAPSPRNDTEIKTLNTMLPFPGWKEVSPFPGEET